MSERKESAISIELKRLALLHGGELQPRAVVDAARDEESPLHKSFTWDDTKAAEQWRLQQARQLISAVVSYEKVGKTTVSVPVFVSLTSDRERDGGGYRLLNTVMSDEQHRRQMLADAVSDMQRFREKYRRLNELAKVFEAMDQVSTPALAQTA